MLPGPDLRPHYTNPITDIYLEDCIDLIRIALAEDAPEGDPTSEAIFKENECSEAKIVAREEGVLCGTQVVHHLIRVFRDQTDVGLCISQEIEEGALFKPGDLIMTIEGSIRGILRLERIILNFLQYLSGISTMVASVVNAAKPDLIVVDTRKTLPGYRKLAKHAVYCGGGTNHRISLSDMILIKDNHIAAAGSLEKAMEKVRNRAPNLPIEVEVDNMEQLLDVLPLHPDYVLLDNMNGDHIREALKIINSYPDTRRPNVEVSGGWNPKRFHEIHGLGPLRVSMSYLTGSSRLVDIAMDIHEESREHDICC